jgi:hypothetical protein
MWLTKHAHEYGFIIRYPQGKEDITGYSYEPWHLRYVGETVAKELIRTGKTLDEYLVPAITVNINDKNQNYQQPSIIIKGRTLVPLRALFEDLGAYVTWHGKTNTVTAIKGNNTITLSLDDHTASVNNERVEIDVTAQIIGSRTVVPVRFVSEAMGAKVVWDGRTETVTVTTD